MGAAVMAPQMHTGKGDVNVDVQCTDVCNDVCTPIPQKVCNDVPYQTQVRHTRGSTTLPPLTMAVGRALLLVLACRPPGVSLGQLLTKHVGC